jgi:hypothetical protein
LPPFVGGGGFPNAVPIVAPSATPANTLATALREEIFMSAPLLPGADLRRCFAQAVNRMRPID